MTPDEIRSIFYRNLDRVQRIIDTYATTVGARRGRASVADSDLLRAATVFLHASLEDLLRMVAQERLPKAGGEVLGDIPLPVGTQRLSKFGLGQLVAYRNLTVEQVIELAVLNQLDRATYNNPGEIRVLLEAMGLDPNLISPHAGAIGAMNSRRHLIVHRADMNQTTGRGHYAARSLARHTVEAWLASVRTFGEAIVAAL